MRVEYKVVDIPEADLEVELNMLGPLDWHLVQILTRSEPFDDLISGQRITGSDLYYRCVLTRNKP